MEQEKETLEEVAERTYQFFKGLQDDIDLSFYDGVRLGAKWQAERMYSEEDLRRAMITIIVFDRIKNSEDITQYITQLKKK